MATMSGQVLVTAEQLLTMQDPGGRLELVRGEVLRMSRPGYLHGVVAGRIAYRLARWVEAHALGHVCSGDTGFVFERDPDTVRAPDVAFVAAARHDAVPGYFPGPPDLAVEVVSPSDTFSAVQAKALYMIERGARAVWVVDPGARTVTVYGEGGNRVLTAADALSGGGLLPGFEVAVAELFAID